MKAMLMNQLKLRFDQPLAPTSLFNWGLVSALVMLIGVGLIAVATSSVEYAGERYGNAFYILQKQFTYLLMGIAAGGMAVLIPLREWDRYSIIFLIGGLLFLVMVLIPGIGKVVNGSRRWIDFGPIALQASEVSKLCFIVCFASYLSRRNDFVRTKWSAFFLMAGMVGIIVLLLLLEPDFGSSVVLCLTLGAMMFVAGVPLLRFLLLASTGVIGMALIAVLSPYRWQRLITFMDPWAHKYDSGYQLVQSLIGFGRGEFWGAGLGEGVQKALFLPEAHTDFIFSVYVEEFGFVGALGLIGLVCFLVYKIARVAHRALQENALFSAFICVGVGVMIAVQSFINMGVASGLLPTKGLTFPFVSYGGSSLLVTCILVGLVFRVDWELRHGK